MSRLYIITEYLSEDTTQPLSLTSKPGWVENKPEEAWMITILDKQKEREYKSTIR